VAGKVAHVRDDAIYVNLGRADEIGIGDRFRVVGYGMEIFDPQTGELLGREIIARGEIEIVRVLNEKLSLARAVAGDAFEVGDDVERE
jgi:hypothetical protein